VGSLWMPSVHRASHIGAFRLLPQEFDQGSSYPGRSSAPGCESVVGAVDFQRCVAAREFSA
jgi:hypothetical protein